MEKTATLNLRVNPVVKERAESVPKVPDEINMDAMTEEQLQTKLKKGCDDVEAGRTHNAADAFAEFRERHKL